MASADLIREMGCSICLNIYADIVTLRCGHSFCWLCISHMLDTQEASGVYSCPECRAECTAHPGLQGNITLCNIMERFLSTHPDQEETRIFSIHCVDSPVPPTKFCLLCEASLSYKHLRLHNRSPEHVLSGLSKSFRSRKCSAHKKVLEYYCTEDSVCICVSCRLDGKHQGHIIESLNEVSEKKKYKLRNVLQKLTTQRQETEKRVKKPQERRRKDQEKANRVRETVTALFRDIRRQLGDLEKRVLVEISREVERVSLIVSNLIQQLEIRKDRLSMKMLDIEELCHMSNPVTVLQTPGDWCDTEDGERQKEKAHGRVNLDVGLILRSLQTISDIITGINVYHCMQGPANILLDVNTANNYTIISES